MKYTGDLMVIKFGTLDLTGQSRALTVDEQSAEIDVTTYGSVDKEFIAGMPDRTSTLDILDDDTSSLARVQLVIGSKSSLVWFPLGTVSGKPMLTAATAAVTRRSKTYPYDDAVQFSVNFRLSGGITEGTAP